MTAARRIRDAERDAPTLTADELRTALAVVRSELEELAALRALLDKTGTPTSTRTLIRHEAAKIGVDDAVRRLDRFLDLVTNAERYDAVRSHVDAAGGIEFTTGRGLDAFADKLRGKG